MNTNMEILIAIIGGVITLAGLFLGPISRALERREGRRLLAIHLEKAMRERPKGVITAFELQRFGVPPDVPNPQPKGLLVLVIFALIVVLFGLLTVLQFWSYLISHTSELIFVAWLFLTMAFGMFTHVLSTYMRTKQPLSQLPASQLFFPLLFSIVVFYPIWGTVGAASHSFFSFYAAFLNGFFWENAVAQAKPPKP